MKTFESWDTFTSSSGLVKVVYISDPVEENRPSVGEAVIIDGEMYRVKAIEPVLKIMDPPIPSNKHGLLVEPTDREASTDDE